MRRSRLMPWCASHVSLPTETLLSDVGRVRGCRGVWRLRSCRVHGVRGQARSPRSFASPLVPSSGARRKSIGRQRLEHLR
jgi:hypothetical protein